MTRRYRRDVYRRFTSPGWIAGHLLVLAAVLTCLRLGWWQWERSNEASGDAQNLGYALLWPAFGAAFVYMWLRFLRLETLKDGGGPRGRRPRRLGAPRGARSAAGFRRIRRRARRGTGS